MENDDEDHNTRMWLSFDGPHQGANISIGLQYGAAFQDDAISLDKFDRSASKQMLQYHYRDESNDVVDAGAPGFRNRFQNELSSLDYPNDLMRVALVNGSTTGEENHTPGENFIVADFMAISWWYGPVFWDSYIKFTQNYGVQTVFEIEFPWPFSRKKMMNIKKLLIIL